MDIDLEFLKELYVSEVRKLKELAFYEYISKETKMSIKKEVLMAINGQSENDTLKEVKGYLKGRLFEKIQEKSGDRIISDIYARTIKIKQKECDRQLLDTDISELRQKDKEKNIYRHAIDYLCQLLIIKKIEFALKDRGTTPYIDTEGKIIFDIKNTSV